MILSYIDPKFCNITSLQIDLGSFIKDFVIFIWKDWRVPKVRKSFKIWDKTVQTILLDFGLKINYSIRNKSKFRLNKVVKVYNQSNLDDWGIGDIKCLDVVDMDEFNDKKVKFRNIVNNKLYGESTRDINTNVHILSDGSFEMLNPRCRKCGSFDVGKKIL